MVAEGAEACPLPDILQKNHVLYVGWSHVLAGGSGIQYITFVATLGHLEDASILGDISEGFEARWSFSGNAANIQEQEYLMELSRGHVHT